MNKMLLLTILVLALALISCGKQEFTIIPEFESIGEIVDAPDFEGVESKAMLPCERNYPIGSQYKIAVQETVSCYGGNPQCYVIGDGRSTENETLHYIWKMYSPVIEACTYFTQEGGSIPHVNISISFANYYEPKLTRLTMRAGRGGRAYVIAKTNTLAL